MSMTHCLLVSARLSAGAYAPKAKDFGEIRPAIEGALIGSD